MADKNIFGTIGQLLNLLLNFFCKLGISFHFFLFSRFTREAESDIYYDTLDSQDKNRDSYSPASPMLRSRIPVKMDNYQTPGIRSRSVTQVCEQKQSFNQFKVNTEN